MKELTSDNLDQVLAENKKVVVQYGAAWCGACRVVKPQLSRLANDYEDIAFYYVDAETYPNSRSFAKVDNLPTFATFVDGKLVSQAMGTNFEKVKGIVNEIANN